MPHPTIQDRGDLAKVVERRMRNWELSRAQKPTPPPGSPPPTVCDFVTLSRSIGSGGRSVAAALGQRLGWPVFDRELLHAMAEDDAVRMRIYQAFDERDRSWLEAAVHWLMRGELRSEDYFYRLSETVLALARREPVIFVGRGCDHILPRDRGLRVWITAGFDRRAAAIAERTGVTPEAARAEVRRVDTERSEFRRAHFGRQADDVTNFDLVLSMDRWTPAQAAGLIVTALDAAGVEVPTEG